MSAQPSDRPGGASVSNQQEGSPDRLDLPENPASRWALRAKAYAFGSLAGVATTVQYWRAGPPPRPTKTVWIDSTLSQWSGKQKFSIDIWIPSTPAPEAGRVAVLVFHGGGFVLGTGSDDSRWAGALMDQLDAVVIGVNYRLAPAYPFPTPVEDSADAILHIMSHSAEYGIDPEKIFASGFSAGGNLVFSSYVLLAHAAQWGYPDVPRPKIRGIVGFYPLVDFTISRKDKRAACPTPQFTLPPTATDLFDQSYLYPPPNRSDPRLSPAKANEEILRSFPPIHLCCTEYDMLLNEGKNFRDRLKGMGQEVTYREVKAERHAWDHLSLTPKPSVKEEYDAAIASINRWLV